MPTPSVFNIATHVWVDSQAHTQSVCIALFPSFPLSGNLRWPFSRSLTIRRCFGAGRRRVQQFAAERRYYFYFIFFLSPRSERSDASARVRLRADCDVFAVKRCSVCPLGVWTASYTETFRLACAAAHSLLRKVNWRAECLRCTLTSCLCTLSPHYFPLCFASVAQVVFCYTLCSRITTTTAGTVVNSQLCPVVLLSEGKRKLIGEKLWFHSMLLLLSCRGEWDVKTASFFGFSGVSIPGPEAFEEETARNHNWA